MSSARVGPPAAGDDAVEHADDAALVRCVQGRGVAGRRAFRWLVQRHYPALLAMVGRFVGSAADAEDVAQEAFLRVYLAVDRCTRPEGFATWLRVTARNVAANHLRGERARSSRMDCLHELQASLARAPAAVVEARQFLAWALASLGPIERQVLILRFIEGLAIREVAEAAKLRESATKMRLARARARLRERCPEYLAGD